MQMTKEEYSCLPIWADYSLGTIPPGTYRAKDGKEPFAMVVLLSDIDPRTKQFTPVKVEIVEKEEVGT